MDILHQIISDKKQEVEKRKALFPVALLEQSIYFNTPVVSFRKYLTREDKVGIIAEYKRKSPSQGFINPYADVEPTSIGYMQAGASALSVLTDNKYFAGENKDLTTARKFNFCPILRKDFIIDEYQLIEAKSIGADVILLIAECLEKERLKSLAETAKNLGLEVLMEIHSPEQLDKLNPYVDVVGVNNRDLTNFKVGIQHSIEIGPLIPDSVIKISESGLSRPESVVRLKEEGFRGFLIGTHFMKESNPAKACAQFISEIEALEKAKKQTV